MPRRTNVNYFASRGAYYCQIGRKQYLLAKGPDDAPRGPTFKAAVEKYRQLLEDSWVEESGDGNTVRTILELYLQQTASQVAPKTQQRRMALLGPFQKALGETRIKELTAFKMEGFLASMQRPRKVPVMVRGQQKSREVSWNGSSVSCFLQTASAAFAWAIKRKLITQNPLVGIARPGIRSRSRDCVITPEQHTQFLQLCRSEGMRQIMIALENTGARPGEIVAAATRYWDSERNALVYPADDKRKAGEFRHKTARHKDRIIYFTGEALALVRCLMKKYPKGPLFRKANGTPYSDTAVQMFFRAFRKRAEVDMPGLSAYSYRHTFATNWLIQGRSIEILAELLGNSPDIIRKHYAHLTEDWRAIRRHLETFRGSTSSDTPGATEILPFAGEGEGA